MMQNMDIRFEARSAGVALWKIADYFGCSEMTINRKLRHEMTPEQKKPFFDAIHAIAAEQVKTNLKSRNW